MEIVSRPHALNMVRFAASRHEVLVLSADLTSSCEANDFRDAYPGRFISAGMTEQNMIGVAAGLAREGFIPFVHTFAVFITRRAFDQVAMSVGYPNLRVRLIGFLPGLTTPGGVTHQAVDDVALMRLIPNMTVVDCGDSTEVESVLDATEKVDGPVYVRMLRGDVPRLFPADEPLHLGEPRILSRGLDIAIFSSGICTEEALRACTALRNGGVSVSHAHVATLKPFPAAQLLAMIATARSGVITMENHFTTGGLGSAVAEIMAENAVHVPLVRLGLRDVYAHGASKQYLMRKYGMDAIALVRAAETILGKQISVNPNDLDSMPLDPVHSLSKPEAL